MKGQQRNFLIFFDWFVLDYCSLEVLDTKCVDSLGFNDFLGQVIPVSDGSRKE